MEFNGTFLISAISFIVFVFIMNSILYKPLRKTIDERNNYINGNYGEADSINCKAKSILDAKFSKIAKAQADSKKQIAGGVESAKLDKGKLIADANVASKNKIESEKNSLINEKSEVANQLKKQVYDLSKDISEKIIGEQFNDFEYNQELVDKAMDNA